jgi:hypothetical protein
MNTPSYKRGYYKFSEIEDADTDKDMKINAINNSLIGEKLSANGYPTIFKVNNRRLEYYGGNRESQELQNWFLESKTKNQQKQKLSEEKYPTRNVNSLIQRIFGGKTKKNKRK